MITIKNDKYLQRLADNIEIEPIYLIKKTTNWLTQLLFLEEEEEYTYVYGLTIDALLDEGDVLVRRCITLLLDNNVKNINLFESLTVIHELKDCPECGCETTKSEESFKNYNWQNITCSNCGFASTTEPDWDSMPGGKDY